MNGEDCTHPIVRYVGGELRCFVCGEVRSNSLGSRMQRVETYGEAAERICREELESEH